MPVLEPKPFLDALRERGFDFYAGVPCSLIKGVLAHLDEQTDVPYVPATREDSALGIAAGAAMGGKQPVVLMQNSGLGVSINALISLHQIYRIPCLLLITWRGYDGKDAPEHIVMGPVMPQVLDTFEIPHRTLLPADEGGSEVEALAALDWATDTLRETQAPVAVFVREGSALMKAREAVAKILEAYPDAVCVCANGYLSREVFNAEDRPGNFYMIGSMGLGASIALGAALAQPEKRVVVIDGDGNVLMGLGAVTVIGSRAPKNLVHLVLDNGVYASTGNQPTVAPNVDLAGIAAAARYTYTADVSDETNLVAELKTLATKHGPVFLRVRIDPEEHPRDFPRVSHTPVEIRDRFQGALRGGA